VACETICTFFTFFYVFFQNPKNMTFYVFLSCCTFSPTVAASAAAAACDSRCVCLCQVAYLLFTELGFISTFRIPVRQFVAYFHTLELGYRHEPCKSRSSIYGFRILREAITSSTQQCCTEIRHYQTLQYMDSE